MIPNLAKFEMQEERLEYVDISTVCRVCLMQPGAVCVFEDTVIEKDEFLNGLSVAQRIMAFACVEVQPTDRMPDKVCNECLTQINQAFKLKAQCEYADATLRELCTVHLQEQSNICFPSEHDGDEGGDFSSYDTFPASEIENKKIMNDHSILTHDETFTADEETRLKDFAETKEMEFSEKEDSCEVGRSHLCEFCGKTFLRPSSLKDHVSAHHTRLKSYLCPTCGKLAPLKKWHYCTEMNDKSNKCFSCDICGKKFVSKTTLFTHKKRHRDKSKFMCNECEKPFFSKQELDRHMRVHLNIRPFTCAESGCGVTFFTRGELNRHIRYHKGIKKFACDLCGKKFFESGHLACHLRKHTGERPYCCRHCPRTFVDSSKLRRHSLAHLKSGSQKGKQLA